MISTDSESDALKDRKLVRRQYIGISPKRNPKEWRKYKSKLRAIKKRLAISRNIGRN